MKQLLIACIFFSAPAFAVSPAICYAISNITVATDWTGGGAANHWASTAGGGAGTCTASGGSGLAIRGVTSTLPIGVPGASASGDVIVINTGVTVHVPVGVGIDLDTASFPTTGDGFTINATSSTVYGALVIDNGGVIRTHGASDSPNNQRGTINQYAWFQIMPGGSLWVGNAANGPVYDVGGHFYSGCGDQTAYPSPFCTGNAGGLVTASVAGSCPAAGLTTGCFTATTALPAGLSAGKMVEIIRPLPITGTYPYQTYDGTTLTADPAQLPATNDTGSVTNNVCGLAASCLFPDSAVYCVVAVSGASVTLGWPRGGNPALPWCTGAETAANITNAGSGSLWLEQPAFVAGDPSVMAWSTSQTHASGTIGATYGYFDSLRSGAVITGAPISNAAGTGPGRVGDNSLNFTSNNFGAVNNSAIGDPCSFRTVQDVVSAGCTINYDNGAIMAFGNGVTFTAAFTYKTNNAESGLVNTGSVRPRAGGNTYEELVAANSDIRNIAGSEFFLFANVTNSAATNNRLAFVYNSVHNSTGEVSFAINTNQANAAIGTPTYPIPVNSNAFFSDSLNTSSYAPNTTGIEFFGSTQYVDVSGNYFGGYHIPINCPVNTISTPVDANIYGVTITSNWTAGDLFFSSGSPNCHWRNVLIQNNRITGFGISDGAYVGSPGYLFAFSGQYSDIPSQPVVIRGNITYGLFRTGVMSGNTQWLNNAFIWNHHHVIVASGQDGSTGSYIPNEIFAGNLIIANDQTGQSLAGLNLGFASTVSLFNVTLNNNTWSGMHGGCLQIGDSDSTFSIMQNLFAYNNICAASTGGVMFAKSQGLSLPSMLSWHSPLIGYNSTQGTIPPTLGVTNPNPNNIPAPVYTRNAVPTWKTGVMYNLDQTRAVTGFAIENPTYTTALATGALQFTRSSSTNMFASWSANNGTNYGTAQQLNWGGFGQTYTVSSTTDPGAAHQYIAIVTTTTPFVANLIQSGSANGSSTPTDQQVVVLTGAKAGTVCSITLVTATNTFNCSPRFTGLAPGDTFAIFLTDVLLPDASGGSVEVGINWAQVPASSQADTGITLGFADYCSTNTLCFGAGALISGIPTTTSPNVTNLPLTPDNLFIPSFHGSAQRAFCNGAAACGGTAYYQPAGTAWQTGGLYGNSLGAVAPNPLPLFGQLIPH